MKRILIPLINISINDFICESQDNKTGLNIGSKVYNSSAYADDITLFNTTVHGLQKHIENCERYLCTWRFELAKTKYFVSGRVSFLKPPTCFLKDDIIANENSIEILGVKQL